MRLLAAGFAAGSLLALVCWGALVRCRGEAPRKEAEVEEEPDDAGARRIERSILEHRLAALTERAASFSLPQDSGPAPRAADADVNRWILAALGEGGPMQGGGEKAEDWINGLLEWVADDRSMNQADLEFAPLRERFVADWLRLHGQGLSPEQRKEFDAFMAEAEGAFAHHLAATAGKPDEERLISGLRATADWNARLEALLDAGQRSRLEPLAVLLDQWRWEPACEPRPLDLKTEEGYGPALQAARERLNPADFDRARPILQAHADALIRMHAELRVARLRGAADVSDVEEFIRYLEIRMKTRQRLIDEVNLRPGEIPPEFLMDYEAPLEIEPDDGEEDR